MAGRQSSISRSEFTELVEYGDEAGGVEGTMGLGDNGWTRGEVVDKEGARVVEGQEGAWEGRLCEEIGRERVDIPVVQKPPTRWQQQQTRKAQSLGHPHRGRRRWK